nr:Ankyrin repeat domain containing protein [Pandoravirus aubagnensis]
MEIVNDAVDAMPSYGWETLPIELRRAIILNWVPDHDLGPCLLAATSFHVLTARDLEARQYAYATVEGMCFAGDVRGLEYALKKRPASEPIDWVMCLLEAALMDRRSIVEWIVARIPPPLGLVDMWTVAPMPKRRIVSKMATHAVFGPHPSGGYLSEARLCSWTCVGNARINALVSRMSNNVDHTTLICIGGAGVAHSIGNLSQSPADTSRADNLVRMNAEYRESRAKADHVRAGALQQELAVNFNPHVIDDLIERGRLADAVSLVTNPAAVCGMPHWIASKLVGHVGSVCACAGQADLVKTLADSMGGPTFAPKYHEGQQAAIVYGAARGGHVDLLEFAVARWPSVVSAATDAVAYAVVGGHVECVRWLCAHGFTCKDAPIWYGQRAAYVSALTLALASGRMDMVDSMRHAVDIQEAARNAFHDAVSDGDLRVARLALSLWMSAPSPPVPDPATARDDLCGMVLCPIQEVV